MKKKFYWKLLNGSVKERRKSAVPHRYSVEYPVGTWVKPKFKGSLLLVFKTKKEAKRFGEFAYLIVKCEIKKAKQQPSHVLEISGNSFSAKSLRDFWTKVANNHPSVMKCPSYFGEGGRIKMTPAGTVFADEVKCLE